MSKLKIYCTTAMVALCAAFVISAPVSAKTPDGVTPSEEEVCTYLQDLSGPYFGLCNAYCEAMDCGDVDEGGNLVHKSAIRACNRVENNFNKQADKDGLDIELTCGAPPPETCPCEEADVNAGFGYAGLALAGDDPVDCTIAQNGDLTLNVDGDDDYFIDTSTSPAKCGAKRDNQSFTIDVSPAEAAACDSVLQGYAATLCED